MDERLIKEYISRGSLRKREPDSNRANSLIISAEATVQAILKISIDENSSTMVFREIYETLRQLGDAKLWKLGYEARQHEPSIKVLQDLDIKNNLDLNDLDRFRKIRNDANYRGYKVTQEQANEIVDFWRRYEKALLNWVKK
ncbi:hypothetical protein CL617_03165 [archaeon]|nr:hypothetical protein [archaeon]|tara:strand:+ start:2679 stop:3104 length:426 start_codon:yes stop_codon:yes gene_type:complete